ncbi:MAG: ABC transporter ATP-binding protein [Phycisphaerae bacterium]|nr:ABC transporter ATP-binding protein [Phycisphaerae bacterium]
MVAASTGSGEEQSPTSRDESPVARPPSDAVRGTSDRDRSDGWAIDVRHAAKTYRRKIHALRDVSLQVARGEIFGLLGPNGAGKSTLVKILMTVIRPTVCTGTLLGRPIGDRPTLARVGYLPEHLRFPSYLTGRQALDYFGALSKVDGRTRAQRIPALLKLVGMTDWATQPVASYSKGMRQRLGLAVALVASPDLVVLDEPTDGVDPIGRKEIRDVLLALRAEGRTVFVNSHLLGELEMVCDRVAIMNKGQVVRQGTIRGLTDDSRRYEIVCTGAPTTPEFDAELARLNATVKRRPAATPSAAPPTAGVDLALNPGETMISLGSVDADVAQPVLDFLRTRRITVVSMRPIRQSLEDLFLATLREAGDSGPGATIGSSASGRQGR